MADVFAIILTVITVLGRVVYETALFIAALTILGAFGGKK